MRRPQAAAAQDELSQPRQARRPGDLSPARPGQEGDFGGGVRGAPRPTPARVLVLVSGRATFSHQVLASSKTVGDGYFSRIIKNNVTTWGNTL